jgi:hypothetical protein
VAALLVREEATTVNMAEEQLSADPAGYAACV